MTGKFLFFKLAFPDATCPGDGSCRVADLGPDVWGTPTNPELMAICRSHAEAVLRP